MDETGIIYVIFQNYTSITLFSCLINNGYSDRFHSRPGPLLPAVTVALAEVSIHTGTIPLFLTSLQNPAKNGRIVKTGHWHTLLQ